jgi:glycosyltransferase involved in cell wall biosynthesis
VRLIYNAIVAENYRPEAYAPHALRQRFDLPLEAKLIGNIGRLSAEKGQRDFIEAAAAVAQRVPNAHFVLIGDGRDRGDLESLAASKGLADRVHFTGHCHDIRPFYRDLDAVALTSYTEGFPNVLLEALCMGKPVVATAVGGVPDIVEDRVTGHLVQPHQVDAIAERLVEVLELPQAAQRTVEQGRLRIRDRFEFGARMERMQTLYEEMLGLQRDLVQARL